MSISELARETKSSNKITWYGLKELERLGIVELIKIKHKQHNPVMVKLR